MLSFSKFPVGGKLCSVLLKQGERHLLAGLWVPLRTQKREEGGHHALFNPSCPFATQKSLIHVEFEINFIPRSHKILRSSFSVALVVCSYSADFQW